MLHKIIFGVLLLFPLSARTEDLVLQKQECEDRLAALIGRAESSEQNVLYRLTTVFANGCLFLTTY